ncbi:MAG: hypothetical protein AAB596_00680 [Patescibacteria group bacterium]
MNHLEIYTNFLKKFLNPHKKLKAVFDCSNGTTGPILKQLTSKNLRLTTYFINNEPNGNFPAHGPDPLKKNAMSDLRLAILHHKADLGIIFDADGDRMFLMDDCGRFINPDVTAKLLIWRLKSKKIIVDVSTGWLIRRGITNNESGINNKKINPIIHNSKFIIQSRVGHYFIKNLMRKKNIDFAAERSGHYYFSHQNPGEEKLYFDSGILAAVHIINAVSKLPYKLPAFNDLLPQYYRSGEINIKGNAGSLIKKIEEQYKNQALKISHIDGLTMEFNSPAGEWWFNLRPSNTEPLIRINIETTSKALLEKKKKELIGLL